MLSTRILSRSLIHPTTRRFSTSPRLTADFTHAVIGAGCVGLSIAQKLQSRDGVSTVLLEKHASVGTETSSRNSEVIHAGICYGAHTLKTKLCIRGKQLLYDSCRKHDIPHRNTGKWVVAQDHVQREAIEKVHAHAQDVGVPTRFLTKDEAQRREPDVRAEAGVLESPTTGIVDSHALMQFLQGAFENSGGICAFHSPVTCITPPCASDPDWRISTTDPAGEASTISAETLINAAGLYALDISRMVLPDEARTALYAKGNYFSYSLSSPRPRTLIYPAPIAGHAGLGTHLTLDMGGRVRFGPDVEWVASPTDYAPNAAKLDAALKDIQAYLPAVKREHLQPDYAGIRPKVGTCAGVSGLKGQDFAIEREDRWGAGGPFVNLVGIESPGLTSCLAIGEEVERLVYR